MPNQTPIVTPGSMPVGGGPLTKGTTMGGGPPPGATSGGCPCADPTNCATKCKK